MEIDLLTPNSMYGIDPDIPAPPVNAVVCATHHCTGVPVAHGEVFTVHTTGLAPTFFDLTDLAVEVTRRSGVEQGQLLASTAHTTCALIVQENEPLFLADLADRLRRFAAEEEQYRHNAMNIRTINVCGIDECANGHSHCQHAVLGASVLLPVVGGELLLGQWQRVLLVELDHPRPREFSLQVTGVSSAPPETIPAP
jgi:secondary thiamine-phosphate synthase enzyme